jgi:hypothetical protein
LGSTGEGKDFGGPWVRPHEDTNRSYRRKPCDLVAARVRHADRSSHERRSVSKGIILTPAGLLVDGEDMQNPFPREGDPNQDRLLKKGAKAVISAKFHRSGGATARWHSPSMGSTCAPHKTQFLGRSNSCRAGEGLAFGSAGVPFAPAATLGASEFAVASSSLPLYFGSLT